MTVSVYLRTEKLDFYKTVYFMVSLVNKRHQKNCEWCLASHIIVTGLAGCIEERFLWSENWYTRFMKESAIKIHINIEEKVWTFWRLWSNFAVYSRGVAWSDVDFNLTFCQCWWRCKTGSGSNSYLKQERNCWDFKVVTSSTSKCSSCEPTLASAGRKANKKLSGYQCRNVLLPWWHLKRLLRLPGT